MQYNEEYRSHALYIFTSYIQSVRSSTCGTGSALQVFRGDRMYSFCVVWTNHSAGVPVSSDHPPPGEPAAVLSGLSSSSWLAAHLAGLLFTPKSAFFLFFSLIPTTPKTTHPFRDLKLDLKALPSSPMSTRLQLQQQQSVIVIHSLPQTPFVL